MAIAREKPSRPGTMASNPRWRHALPLMSVLLPVAALAGEWEKGASVNIGTYYTTNVCLVNPAIADEEDKVVGTFTPRVNVSGRGARSRLNLRAAAEYNSLADSSLECPVGSQAFNINNRKAWVPSGSFDANLEAIENWANLYATASATQSALNPFLSGGDENANALGNTNLIYQWAVGVNIDRRLSRAWQLQADVQHNRQYNSENQAIGNSEENRATYDIGTRPFVSRFFYGSRGSYSEIDFEPTDIREAFTNRLSRAELYLGVALTDALLVEGAYGVEDNVFTSLNNDVDGTYWDVGFQWQPLARVSVSAGYGERFFGDTPRFNVSYRHKRSTLQAGYLRDIQYPRDIRAATPEQPEPNAPEPPVTEVPGSPLGSDGLPTFLGNSPVQNDSFFVSYSLVGRRSQFVLSGSVSEQTQLASGQVADFQSVRAQSHASPGFAAHGVRGRELEPQRAYSRASRVRTCWLEGSRATAWMRGFRGRWGVTRTCRCAIAITTRNPRTSRSIISRISA
jgi:uncharacterized protein (PEP-CTERM system associated)